MPLRPAAFGYPVRALERPVMHTPPSVRRILETALYCDDLARTAAFYQHLLNATPMLSGDRLVAFDAGGATVLLLFQRGNSGAIDTDGGRVPGHDGDGRYTSPSRLIRRNWTRGMRGSRSSGSPLRAASRGGAAARVCTSAIPMAGRWSSRRQGSGRLTDRVGIRSSGFGIRGDLGFAGIRDSRESDFVGTDFGSAKAAAARRYNRAI